MCTPRTSLAPAVVGACILYGVDSAEVVQDTLATLVHQLAQRQVQVYLDSLPVISALGVGSTSTFTIANAPAG